MSQLSKGQHPTDEDYEQLYVQLSAFTVHQRPLRIAMVSSTFNSVVNITHIGTATALIDIDGVVFLTDPAFDPAGSEYPIMETVTLMNEVGPALTIAQLPHIDAVALSHEDHPDNLDTNGRILLEGRGVFTTRDGAKNLGPRPASRVLVTGIRATSKSDTKISRLQPRPVSMSLGANASDSSSSPSLSASTRRLACPTPSGLQETQSCTMS